MSITVDWDNDARTIVRFTYVGRWTLNEFYAALDTHHRLLDTIEHSADTLIDARTVNILPDGVMTQFKQVSSIRHPNERLSVIVSGSALLKSIFSIYAKLYPMTSTRYAFATSLDEAYQVIRRQPPV